MTSHPLQPLSAEELRRSVELLQSGGHLTITTRIVSVNLVEPTKQFVFNWRPGQDFPRIAEAILADSKKSGCCAVKVDLQSSSMTKQEYPGVHSGVTIDEMLKCVEAVLSCEDFWNKIKEHYGDHPIATRENIVCEPWAAGYYGEDDNGRRLLRPICFFMDRKSQNPYAYPIEGIRPTVDINTMEVIGIEDFGKWPLPPEHDSRFRADLIDELRTDVKPLEITQPEGASFTVNDNQLNWQKWSMVTGFNGREGLTLHDVRYDGRSILYRAAVAEMIVPYGDPSIPQARKNVFDIGEYGIGYLANSLSLGCDCLGEIKYLDANLMTSKGEPLMIKNAVCVHEEDYGILWKHTDRRYDTTEVRRSRRFVVSSFATVGNYDYGFYWYFYQDGNIQLEVKLTGFLSLGAVHENEDRKYGNSVAPQLFAPCHQHIFSARLDFAVDGVENSVFEIDAVSDEPGPHNPYKNAFYGKATRFETEREGRSLVNPSAARTWNVTNENKRNRVGMPVAYKLIPHDPVHPLAAEDSFWRKRARFVDYDIWVTPFNENEYFPAGPFPNQSREDQGLGVWTQQDRKVANEDVVVWHTFGVTHIPRPEDYPIMPTVYAGFLLKPFGFFDRNPSWDVPPQCHVNKKPASRAVE